jgi:hypothetical protein
MKQSPYHFFLSHAGYSYDPATETRMQGRIRCAQAMAKAEMLFEQCEGKFFDRISSIEYVTEEDFTADALGDCEDIEDYRSGKYIMLRCAIVRRSPDGKTECLASLHGVSVTGWNDPYLRVVRAELAMEAEDDLQDYLAEQTEQQITE